MDDFQNPMYAAEPYEESQGRNNQSAASPDVLAAFYKDMERKETVERKLSKRRTSGTSIWSRKSVRRTETAHTTPLPVEKSPQPVLDNLAHMEKAPAGVGTEKFNNEDNEKPDWVTPVNSPRSIIPDAKELPAWYSKDTWSSVPLPSYRVRYLIHDPVGPRWYKNHHLIPPSETTPAARPPSFFSPSFPPMASSVSQDRSDDVTRLPGTSGTPSSTPLPTPNSSQTGVTDKPRSRKTSQTAHDTVDLLDITDPWGTNWHHHSPYDVGLGNGPISADVQGAMHTRSRRSSTTTQNRGRTLLPSPLSQSTSAIHLQISPDPVAHVTRKLSKRQTPTLVNIFGAKPQESTRDAEPFGTSPTERQQRNDLPRRMSIASPTGLLPSVPQSSPSKKEKRGSILGRLVKKFSILKKSASESVTVSGKEEISPRASNAVMDSPVRSNDRGQPSPEKHQFEPIKRIPPPTIDDPGLVSVENAGETGRTSPISLEAPYSMARLTVANPDSPASLEATPAIDPTPLPPDKGWHDIPRTSIPSTNSLLSSDDIPPTVPEKILVIPMQERAPEMPLPETPRASSPSSTVVQPPSEALESPEPPQKDIYPSAQPSSNNNNITVQGTILSNLNKEKSTHRSRTTLKHMSLQQPSFTSRDDQLPKLPSKDVRRPVSVASSIPFPGTDVGSGIYSADLYNSSPLSAASIIANPPTPYSPDTLMPETPNPPPPLPLKPSAAVSRQTETFRLVRSSSGNVYGSTETIVAGGQQWEIVGSTENERKAGPSNHRQQLSKDRESNSYDHRKHHKDSDTKDRSYKSRDVSFRDNNDKDHREVEHKKLEKRRESRSKKDIEYERESHAYHHSQHSRNNKSQTQTASEPRNARETYFIDVRRDEATSSHQDGKRSSRRRDHQKSRLVKKQEASIVSAAITKAELVLPPGTQHSNPSRPLERLPSLSARPTSQLPSAEEMNAMRAKEAWEMERLWKARSMQSDGLKGYTTIPSNQNTPLMGYPQDIALQGALHGSSHTAFVVQNGFQAAKNSIYHSMPAAPPPIIYSSPPSVQSITQNTFPGSQQFYAESIVSNYSSSSRRPNPLPEPPREFPYEIPIDIQSSEYWSKHAGLTASH